MTKPHQDDDDAELEQVECPAANFKCAQSNSKNSNCGGVRESGRAGGSGGAGTAQSAQNVLRKRL